MQSYALEVRVGLLGSLGVEFIFSPLSKSEDSLYTSEKKFLV